MKSRNTTSRRFIQGSRAVLKFSVIFILISLAASALVIRFKAVASKSSNSETLSTPSMIKVTDISALLKEHNWQLNLYQASDAYVNKKRAVCFYLLPAKLDANVNLDSHAKDSIIREWCSSLDITILQMTYNGGSNKVKIEQLVKLLNAEINLLSKLNVLTPSTKLFIGGIESTANQVLQLSDESGIQFSGYFAISPIPSNFPKSITCKNIQAASPLYTSYRASDFGKDDLLLQLFHDHKDAVKSWVFDSISPYADYTSSQDMWAKETDLMLRRLLVQHLSIKKMDYDSLSRLLLTVDELDQKYRNQLDDVIDKYGDESNEAKVLFKNMAIADSINCKTVCNIIDHYGWLDKKDIGDQANATLFFVIQHAKFKVQKKYLPIMREAVKYGHAKASHLAMLEDRVALLSGKKQIYGSQLSWNMHKNTYFVMPLIDPDNVDVRRAAVGLKPIAEYLAERDIPWNVEEYKRTIDSLATHP